MNLLLHWLRRELRRHAPALALWALLVALFTWARIWLRTHPDFFMGDRDLWLSLPAAALGFAEVCLLLRVLLDDPARGAHAFWKTRPPSGAVVFGAKAAILVLAALVVPLTAEAVFLGVVGLSSGGAERFSLYLVPPLLALTAGAAAANWRMVFVWLPLAVLGAGAAWISWVWTMSAPPAASAADLRLCTAVALAAAAAAGAWAYRRRTAGPLAAGGMLILPVIAAAGVTATGWLADPRLTTPPPGRRVEDIAISHAQQPRVHRDYEDGRWGLNFSLKADGIQPDEFAVGEVGRVTLTPDGHAPVTLPVMEGDRRFEPYTAGGVATFWNVRLHDWLAGILQTTPTTISGTLHIRCYDRKRHSLPLQGTHTVETSDGCWRFTPVTDPPEAIRWRYIHRNPGGLFCRVECISTARPGSWAWQTFGDSRAAFRRLSDGLELRADGFAPLFWPPVWEGAATFYLPVGIGVPAGERRLWQDFHRELSDTVQQADWRLEFDTLTFTGTLEVPFSLRWPEK